jgi:leader peptidase (prepilin peptidase)/N-methyltransferase
VFVLGLAIGSFLNVCIWRLPRNQSLVRPGSRCPRCRRPIRWHDNVPVISFLLLGGRCRHCRKSIHWRYPLVELLTGALLALVAWHVGVGWHFLLYGLLVCGLIVSTFIDFDHQIIPDEITIPGMIVGVAASILYPALHGERLWGAALYRSALGGAVGGGSLFLMGVIGQAIFRRESMGGGDVKLLAMVGTFLGWEKTLVGFFVAPLFGAIGGIAVKIRYRTDIVPYGPYLSIGSVITMLWGDAVIRWLLGA